MSHNKKDKKKIVRRFIIGCEDLQDGMIIEVVGDIEKAKEIIHSLIDIHEVNDKNEVID